MSTTTSSAASRSGTTAGSQHVDLAITGMTCASCSARIERKLNKLDGVTATVNYATEKAKVAYPAGMSSDELLKAVEALRREGAEVVAVAVIVENGGNAGSEATGGRVAAPIAKAVMQAVLGR